MEQPDNSSPDRSPFESARSLAGSFIALVSARVELAVLELREQAERSKQITVLAVMAGAFFAMAAFLFALFVVVLFWDTHRVAAAGAMTLLYLAVGAIALSVLKRRSRESPPPFEATLAELSADVEALRGRHE